MAIHVAGADRFGVAGADRDHEGLFATFAFLVDYPRAARERMETSPPGRAFRDEAHLIVHELDDEDPVTIVRVQHGREDRTSDT